MPGRKNHNLNLGTQEATVLLAEAQAWEQTGLEGSIVAAKVMDSQDLNFGYDAVSGKYTDLVKAGVIVPTKVERAASVRICGR